MAQTMFDKIWQRHIVKPAENGHPAVIYIDLHLIHEVTSPQAFTELKNRGLTVRRPDKVLATLDHSTPTSAPDAQGQRKYVSEAAWQQVRKLQENCRRFGIHLHGFDSPHRGIVHVMGPELGATQPGMTIVCGDSHTATHGAFGALAFGIGTTEVGHVLATQSLLQHKPKTLRVWVDNTLRPGVGAKDLILHIIGKLGMGGGTGHVIEYAGPAIEALTMEERMTVCNMSIEAGARAGLIAPDETTFNWLRGRQMAPKDFDAACADWRTLRTDEGASFDKELRVDAAKIGPTITYGTHPGMVIPIGAAVPAARDEVEAKALSYMNLKAGEQLSDRKVDIVFIGSCTNGRLSDMREAANELKGHKVAKSVRMMVVPGSEDIKRQAEAEGLDKIILAAGAEWREPGCSMCIAMNGDMAKPGQTVVSTSNRNFAGRQGPGSQSFLASPAVAARAAVSGFVCEPQAIEETA
ncbi:3-isopropylmalate dehydratase large subunit [Gallaecimonas pentaromativorans]|uniref:3-isopropylmalate dehydratase large subunit n=1 Tax=Gallaecimonas pentaromativorans TaxID=584787 RepID=A0A3N1P6B7_9GAMM|nr:3-isopropylmalate dehydratase large subunit [Gallaecimonas pentaromativorans]ROQ22667.1 3-isopropylmalate/(R)-2-methylmalate dehydratase large subunit [Gallaecimonas pentaromativorans]